jgi:uncharacterized membrane protein
MTMPDLATPLSPDAAPSAPVAARGAPFPTSLALQAFSIFALAGASFGLLVASVSRLKAVRFTAFLQSNSVEPELRLRLFLFLVAGAVIALLPPLGVLLLKGRRVVPALRQAAEILLPFCLVGVLRSLFTAQPWHDEPLTFVVGLSIVVLVLERALRRSLAALPEGYTRALAARLTFRPVLERRLPLGAVLLGSLGYAIYFSYYTLLNHHRLATTGFDLGINVNWAYNALHGHFSRNTVALGESEANYFGVHAVFAMLSWLPFFAIHPGAEFFLIFQAVSTGFAATTLYLFAATQIPRWSAVVVAYAYLFFAPLHGPNFYDFHELMPPLFFHFLLYWAIAKNKNWLVYLLVPVLWSYREDITIGLTVLGFFLMVTGTRPRLGLIISVSSLIWFVVMKLVIMPRLWNGWFDTIYTELQAGQRGYGTILMTITSNPAYFLTTLLKPEKLVYFLHMFAPLVFLPARRWSLLLLALPGFAFSLLTTGYPPTISIAFQYTCHAIPYVFCASVLMLGLMSKGVDGHLRRRAVLGAMILGVASHSYVFGAVLQHETFVGGFSKIEFQITDIEKHRYLTMQRLKALIPESASVAATEMEVPHIAARLNAYTLKDGPADADFILVNRLRMNIGDVRGALTAMFQRERYGLLSRGDDLYLFKRGLDSPDTDAALADLGLHLKKRH